MNENVKIKKAKIKDDLFLEVEYVETLPFHSKKDTKLSCTVPIHDDLKTSFSKLHKHLAILCDEVKTPTKAKYAQEDYPEFTVRGFSIGGTDENEGITISGSKEGLYGIVNLNTPFTKFESADYPFVSELGEDIQVRYLKLMSIYSMVRRLLKDNLKWTSIRLAEKQRTQTFNF